MLCDHAVAAGAFRIRTVTDGGKRVLNSLLGVADLRSRHTRFPYGDQTLFMRREVFQQVGGFPELPVFEDVAMARRLRSEGALRTLDTCVEVSGRRFMKQPVRTTLAWTLLPLLFRAGVPPSALAALYRPVR